MIILRPPRRLNCIGTMDADAGCFSFASGRLQIIIGNANASGKIAEAFAVESDFYAIAVER